MAFRAAVYSGGCERLFASGRRCGRPARYVVYGTRHVCRQCYQAYGAGRLLLFDPGRAPTAAERWALMQRLREDLPCRR